MDMVLVKCGFGVRLLPKLLLEAGGLREERCHLRFHPLKAVMVEHR